MFLTVLQNICRHVSPEILCHKSDMFWEVYSSRHDMSDNRNIVGVSPCCPSSATCCFLPLEPRRPQSPPPSFHCKWWVDSLHWQMFSVCSPGQFLWDPAGRAADSLHEPGAAGSAGTRPVVASHRAGREVEGRGGVLQWNTVHSVSDEALVCLKKKCLHSFRCLLPSHLHTIASLYINAHFEINSYILLGLVLFYSEASSGVMWCILNVLHNPLKNHNIIKNLQGRNLLKDKPADFRFPFLFSCLLPLTFYVRSHGLERKRKSWMPVSWGRMLLTYMVRGPSSVIPMRETRLTSASAGREHSDGCRGKFVPGQMWEGGWFSIWRYNARKRLHV